MIEGSNYTVSPLSGDHQFTPLNHLIMNLSGNTTVPDFTGRSLRHKLVGTIREQGTNQPVVGVTVTLSGTQSGTVQTNPMGRYEFPNLHETGTYTVTPTFGFGNLSRQVRRSTTFQAIKRRILSVSVRR
ncbi:MAG: carboxypeptidase regulatory-like domain-containing protein [Acidobacteria bacterium]|nr:carboxypeptidase regulatory-like domain-containing protein [Acidobacteriota bacterium]